jgi:hypothetical protein
VPARARRSAAEEGTQSSASAGVEVRRGRRRVGGIVVGIWDFRLGGFEMVGGIDGDFVRRGETKRRREEDWRSRGRRAVGLGSFGR